MLQYLKIKIKSLAAESRMIRQEEIKERNYARNSPRFAKQHDRVRQGLYEHRIVIVRSESRASLLAYGYLRGKKRSQLEKGPYQHWYIEARITTLAHKYGPEKDINKVRTAIHEWLQE